MSDDGRDYPREMDARIGGVTAGSGWVPAVVAQKLHAELLEHDLDLLEGWLAVQAPDLLRQAITLRLRRSNRSARRLAKVRDFADAAREVDAADSEPEREAAGQRLLSMFTMTHAVDDEDTRKRACDMTGPEHLFVAENQYEIKVAPLLMLAAFHRAVAKKVGKRLTSEVLTEEQYEQMYLSVTRKAA